MSPTGTGLGIADQAASLMAYIEAAYALASGTAPLPTRRAVTGGEVRLIAWDCEQATVALVGIDIDVPASGGNVMNTVRLGANTLRHVALTAQIVRCTAEMDSDGVVDIAEINSRGLQMMRDAGLLSQALFEWAAEQRSDGNSAGVLATEAGAVIPVGPAGGYMAVEGSVIISSQVLV